MTIAKRFRRAMIWLPAMVLCVWLGQWFADIAWPQGMSFGEPLADRVGRPLNPDAYSIDLAIACVVLAMSLFFADLVTPKEAQGVLLCFGALFGGALYYELLLGNLIDELFRGCPRFVGDALALTSLLWPHVALVAVKLSVGVMRVPERTLPSGAEAR